MNRATLLFVAVAMGGCAAKAAPTTSNTAPVADPVADPAPVVPSAVLYCVRAAEDASIGICERELSACQQIADGVAASGTAVTPCAAVSEAWCSNMRSLADGTRVETCYPTTESCEIGLVDYQQNYTDRYDDMQACAPWSGR